MNAADGFVCRSCGATEYHVTAEGIRDWEFGAGREASYAYRQCRSCDLVQLHPFPRLEDLIAAYPSDYVAFVDQDEDRGALYRFLFRLQNRLFLRQLRSVVPKGARVLDVGCGNGGFLERLRPLGVAELHGIDFSPHAVELAARKGVVTFQGVFEDFAATAGTFDAVFMNHYIEHVLHPAAELRKACAVLKPGGWLIGELPNYDSIDRRIFGRYWGGNHIPRHTFQYSPATLGALLRDAGFADVTFHHEINPGHFVLSIQNFLQRRATDLKKNPRLRNGRMKSFNLLLVLLAPLHALFAFVRKSGMLRFRARRP
jgi:SAM-dependent methyltransferase